MSAVVPIPSARLPSRATHLQAVRRSPFTAMIKRLTNNLTTGIYFDASISLTLSICSANSHADRGRWTPHTSQYIAVHAQTEIMAPLRRQTGGFERFFQQHADIRIPARVSSIKTSKTTDQSVRQQAVTAPNYVRLINWSSRCRYGRLTDNRD